MPPATTRRRKAPKQLRLTDAVPTRDRGFLEFVDACSWEEVPHRYDGDIALLLKLTECVAHHETAARGWGGTYVTSDEPMPTVGELGGDDVEEAIRDIEAEHSGWHLDAPQDASPHERLDAHFAPVVAHHALLGKRRAADLESWARREQEAKVAMADAELRSYGLS